MLRTLILHDNNTGKLLGNWEICPIKKQMKYLFSLLFKFVNFSEYI